MRNSILAFSTALALTAGAANAAVVFHDDFSTYGSKTVLEAPDSLFGGAWSTSSGTIDYLAHGSNWGYLCIGGGNCIDLDGGTSNAGMFSSMVFAAGNYVLDLGLFGNGRNRAETVTVSLGSWSIVLGPIAASDDASGSWAFSTTGGSLSFQNSGGDNAGAILTSVTLSTISAIPLPAGAPLLLGGLSLMGFAARRRKAKKT